MPEVNKSLAIRDYFKANPKAKAQEVVDALARKGITTTVNYVNNLKTAHNRAHAARKAASPGKKPEVTKTQAVQEFLKANKKATNSEVVDALATQGISITSNYVGNIKSTKNKRRRAMRTVVAKSGIGIPEVKAALAFIKTVGSVAAAKQALAVAQEIKKIV
jgi:hypothetical protein